MVERGEPPERLPHAAGHAVVVGRDPARAVRGWILDPDHGPYEEVRVVLDGVDAGAARRMPAPGVGARAPWLAGARESGFAFEPEGGLGGVDRVDVVGIRDGAPAGRYRTMSRTQADLARPVPPMEIARPSSAVAQGGKAELEADRRRFEQGFLGSGLATAANLLHQIAAHHGSAGGLRLLDWGCGCGRVVRHLADRGFASVAGCDVDGTAIEWCRENLAGVSVSHSRPDPPLPFEPASFDVLVSCSVFTHLDPDNQARWLAELRRVVAPGGLALVSTQGDFAYRRGALRGGRFLTRWPALAGVLARRLSRKLEREGFIDRGATRALAGVVPAGYYRSVAQTCEYTRREWSSHFEIVDCIDRGLDGFQDLVVMRRPR